MNAQLLQLFEAFKQAESDKRSALANRGNNFGIAVASDYFAIQYQRADAKARVAENQLRRLLGQEPPEPTCDGCGWPVRICNCDKPWFRALTGASAPDIQSEEVV